MSKFPSSGPMCGIADVYALAVYDDKLFVGGYFWIAGLMPIFGIASWDETKWSGVGPGMNIMGNVRDLTVFNGTLIVGGCFIPPETSRLKVSPHGMEPNGHRWDQA